MEKLFGIPIGQLMIGLLVIFGVGVGIMAIIAARNPVWFKMAVRNLPRRRTQTALIVVGLMLATLLFSAALATGDTLSHSVRVAAINGLGLADATVSGEEDETTGRPAYFDAGQTAVVQDALAGDAEVVGVAPMIRETAAVVALRSNLSEPIVDVLGIEQSAMTHFDQVVGESGDTLSTDELAANEVYVSRQLADELDAVVGDMVRLYLSEQPAELRVAGIYAEGPKPAGELSLTLPLAELQSLTDHVGEINLIIITNEGDAIAGAEHAAAVLETLETTLADTGLTAESNKQEGLDTADEVGSSFSSIFLLFGQFSIAAGILLIFLIFVMLAAERKQELGIARAIGAQRRHVIRLFTFEGAIYAIMAAAVGSLLGVIVGWVMVRVLAVVFGQIATGGFNIVFFFNPRSLIIAYTLGMVFTFMIVLVSSWRVSRLNIVRAIRDIPEPKIRRNSIKGWIFTILLPIIGVLLTLGGVQAEQLGLFMLGTSLIIIGLPLLAWRLGVPDRLAFTSAGVGLLIWWLVASNPLVEALFPDVEGGIELFFISGIMVVLGAVWTVIYNSDLITDAIVLIFSRVRGLPPVLRMAMAYAMNNRFRTGMSLAMFSLIVFTLVVMSFIILAFGSAFNDVERISSGFDIRAQVGYANPINDLEAAIAASEDLNSSDFDVIASFTGMPIEVVQDGTGQESTEFVLTAADVDYLENVTYDFTPMAEGYETAVDVWRALGNGEDVVVVQAFLVPTRSTVEVGDFPFQLEEFFREDEVIPDIFVTVTSPFTGQSRQLQVIGVLEAVAFYSGGPLLTSQEVLTSLAPVTLPANSYLIQVKEGVDVATTAKALEATFVENGLQVTVTAEEIKQQANANLMLNSLLQGFMGLGLVVGIAALGVISARTVVERYHQIGVLRAIGFQRGMVQFAFILESSFIALLGIALGIALGMGISRNVIESFSESIDGIQYAVPWSNIIAVAVIAYGASLLMTLIAARQAAKVQPAEALRYE